MAEEGKAKVAEVDPLMSTIPAVANGAIVLIDAETELAAATTPSILSIPACIDDYLALLNEANEKVISLNDKVAELQPIVDKYNDKMAKEEEEKNAQLVNEKREYYKNKFEQLGARSKFESEEVQNLINNCIKDDKSMSKLNLMIVDLISVENAKPKAKTEKVADMDNLLVIEEDITSKYGFR